MFAASTPLIKRFLVLTGVLALGACQTVSTTEPGLVGVTRSQNMLLSSSQLDQASVQAYGKLLKTAASNNTLNNDPVLLARVRSSAQRLIDQTATFRADAPSWRWEVNVFQSEQINAFCMAGGKIGVYSGLISKLGLTDAELAAVIGHEIAHALREHVREQVSLQYAMQLPGMVLAVATRSQALGQLGDMVSKVTLGLPRSRLAESEADVIGLELAARAGYDPRAAVSLWQKMNRLGGSRSPEFLSTHPSPANREEDLSRMAERVMPLYQAAQRP